MLHHYYLEKNSHNHRPAFPRQLSATTHTLCIDFLFWTFPINGITPHTIFYFWLISLSIVFLAVAHVAANSTSSLSLLSNIWRHQYTTCCLLLRQKNTSRLWTFVEAVFLLNEVLPSTAKGPLWTVNTRLTVWAGWLSDQTQQHWSHQGPIGERASSTSAQKASSARNMFQTFMLMLWSSVGITARSHGCSVFKGDSEF